MRYLELLAPARDLETGRLAVDFGADAVYIGGASFGARRAASNSVEDIASLVEYAHGYGARVYATLNTVILEDELAHAESVARELCDAGVDALIVQDMAFARMGLPVALHASTQTCNTTAQGVRFLADSGFSRVILERGLTLDQIRDIGAQNSVELEAFVHGAICVGYSGQCYLSRTMGARSGNRGDCMQACRMSYDLIDQDDRTIIRGKHLLSVQDMNLSTHIDQLVEAGVDSFKIEGRLKDATYIKSVVGYYREAMDRQIEGSDDLARSSVGRSVLDFRPDPERSFSRAGSTYFIDGKRAGVASFDTPKAMGSYVGRVVKTSYRDFVISEGELSAGDGICFIVNGKLVGTNINGVQDSLVTPNRMDDIIAGTEIYRNYDHRYVAMLEASRVRRVIDVRAEVKVNQSEICVALTDQTGVTVGHSLCGMFDAAQNAEKMLQTLKNNISKSGDTIFNINSVTVGEGSENYFVPISIINELRRDALDKLRLCRLEQYARLIQATEDLQAKYLSKELGRQMNVTNSLAEQFYRDHGVTNIAPGLDLNSDEQQFEGERVMVSSYCIRREIGECLLENPKLKGDLYLQRAIKRYKLEFDCKQCQMSIIYIK